MNPRNWKPDAWWLCQKYCYPGSVPVVEKALAHGYEMGLADATKEIKEALDKEAERKRVSNSPR